MVHKYSEKEVSDFLKHHGILGQKWGVRRTPEQLGHTPSSSKSSSSQKTETKEERHARLMKSTNAKELYKHRKEFTTEELQNRLNRINVEKQLKNLSQADRKKGLKMAKDALEWEKVGVGFLKTTSQLYDLSQSKAGKAAKKALEKKFKKGSD